MKTTAAAETSTSALREAAVGAVSDAGSMYAKKGGSTRFA